jgi:hypothetical protein
MTNPGLMIPPDAYPQMVSKADAAKVARMLKSPEVAVRGARVIEERATGLRGAVRDYVGELEAAVTHAEMAELANEIRGFAETAGLAATGRIADGLCRYFDGLQQLGATPDDAVIRLHISAIVRAARAENEANQMNEVVAGELSALVNHKIAEAGAHRSNAAA